LESTGHWSPGKYLRLISALILTGVVFFSCARRNPLQDRAVFLAEGDPRLFDIAFKARETLPRFIWRLQHPARGERGFSVKYPLEVQGETETGGDLRWEYLWLGDIDFKNGIYYGRLLNQPRHINSVKAGDIIPFAMDDITDWMFFREDKIIGGLSIKYLAEKELNETESPETPAPADELVRLLEMFGSPSPYSIDQ
jgi:uncharacterized protein YegJ (DUF2314 family)